MILCNLKLSFHYIHYMPEMLHPSVHSSSTCSHFTFIPSFSDLRYLVSACASDSSYADYVTNACKGMCIYVCADCHVCGNAPLFGVAADKS